MKISKFLVIIFLTLAGCTTSHNKISKPTSFDAKPNEFWWPNKINLSPLRAQVPLSNPYGENFNYAKEFILSKVETGSELWILSKSKFQGSGLSFSMFYTPNEIYPFSYVYSYYLVC